jgi:DUF1365 family protein
MHVRFKPKRHRFRYRIASLLLDLDELPDLNDRLRFFSVDRPNLFAFYNRDHGPRDGSPVKPWVEAAFARAGRPIPGGRVLALCLPRTLGYAFDPLTVYWGYRSDSRLAGVLYEVKNTFGDQHAYMVPAPIDHRPGTPLIQAADKRFHVSPFFDRSGGYRFRIDEPGDRLRVMIRLVGDDGQDRLIATQTAERRELGDAALLRTLAVHPANTIKVIAGIHWEALRLWLKGATFHRRPEPPAEAISTGRNLNADRDPARAA